MPESEAGSLDQFVRSGEQRGRHGKAERFGGFQIYSQLKTRGLLDRDVSGPLALQYSVSIISHTTRNPALIRAIGHEGSRWENLLHPHTGRKAMCERKLPYKLL